jgi:ribosome-associated protein
MPTKRIPQAADVNNELIFIMSRSSGPGGQNVNKVNSKVTLKFDVANSSVLSAEQKELIATKLATRMTKEGILILTAQDKRSQMQNKEAVVFKLDQLLRKAFTPRKTRRATKPGKAAAHARIKAKKHRSEKKQWRSKKME